MCIFLSENKFEQKLITNHNQFKLRILLKKYNTLQLYTFTHRHKLKLEN